MNDSSSFPGMYIRMWEQIEDYLTRWIEMWCEEMDPGGTNATPDPSRSRPQTQPGPPELRRLGNAILALKRAQDARLTLDAHVRQQEAPPDDEETDTIDTMDHAEISRILGLIEAESEADEGNDPPQM